MADELASFRKLAVRVYDTMTQDVNDVLTNEHAELCEFYREKIDYYSNKMMRCIDEIYDICPNFDFDRYYSEERQEYLQSEFPVPDEVFYLPTHHHINQPLFLRMTLIQKNWKCLSDKKCTTDCNGCALRAKDSQKRTKCYKNVSLN